MLTLYADAAGRIWIGTEGGGLNRFDPTTERFTIYTTADGLPHDNVTGILEDDAGYLWVSTNSGIARFDPASEEFWTFREATGLAGERHYASFTAPGDLPKTPVGMELRQDVYLLYKELLQNVLKHSEARSVAVEIRYEAPMLTLTVRDDGRGFDPDDPALGNGLGLMKGRAEKHGGTLVFDSAPGYGTRAQLVVRMR